MPELWAGPQLRAAHNTPLRDPTVPESPTAALGANTVLLERMSRNKLSVMQSAVSAFAVQCCPSFSHKQVDGCVCITVN